jgi:hypothetical protein
MDNLVAAFAEGGELLVVVPGQDLGRIASMVDECSLSSAAPALPLIAFEDPSPDALPHFRATVVRVSVARLVGDDYVRLCFVRLSQEMADLQL